jgi:predicted RNA binding protein YcfA (HicA-like mRNA interferase family)
LGEAVQGFYKVVARILLDHGCKFVRQANGSHEMWYSPITERHFPVPTNLKSRHTANAIMKQAGIDHHF